MILTSWMWTLQIKRGVVFVDLVWTRDQDADCSVIVVADAGPEKVQLQCYLAVNLLYPDTNQRQGRTVLKAC